MAQPARLMSSWETKALPGRKAIPKRNGTTAIEASKALAIGIALVDVRLKNGVIA